MLKRFSLAVLLVLQALGGGAITLAHARESVAAPPGYEAGHSARCAILHDELRCALCHYASAHVVTPQTLTMPEPTGVARFAPEQPLVSLAAVVRLTAPARAPPPSLS